MTVAHAAAVKNIKNVVAVNWSYVQLGNKLELGFIYNHLLVG